MAVVGSTVPKLFSILLLRVYSSLYKLPCLPRLSPSPTYYIPSPSHSPNQTKLFFPLSTTPCFAPSPHNSINHPYQTIYQQCLFLLLSISIYATALPVYFLRYCIFLFFLSRFCSGSSFFLCISLPCLNSSSTLSQTHFSHEVVVSEHSSSLLHHNSPSSFTLIILLSC